MISLVDLLRFTGIPLRNYKIHLADYPMSSPLDAYYAGRFKEWQEEQRNKNFQCDMVVGLIHLRTDRWLFAGVYKILGIRRETDTHYYYQTDLLPGQEELIGRVIVRYRRQFRAAYISGSKYGHQLEVAEIRPEKVTIEPFPGYTRIVLSYDRLTQIVRQQDPSWKAALSSVKGVYLIVDSTTGQTYVGSATGNDGIWQRWTAYAENGHGGNKELKQLLGKRGMKYARHFQFTLLEIADFHATDGDIVAREQHWKAALLSRKQGYNRN